MVNSKDLDIVISMYNLLKHSDNYSDTSGSLWNYYRDEMTDDANENDNANYRINHNKTITSKSFEYKTKIIGTTPANNNTLNTGVVAPLKYLSYLWRSLNVPLINCEIEFDFRWSVFCVISEVSKHKTRIQKNSFLE